MNKLTDNFWPSYVDLLLSIFFVILVLFAISFISYNKEIDKANTSVRDLKKIEEIKSLIKNLMKDSTYFIYEPKFKRYKLTQEVKFEKKCSQIKENEISDYFLTVESLRRTGLKLKEVIDTLIYYKKIDSLKKDLSYLVLIEGRASNLPGNDTSFNYSLSYQRAYSLFKFWKKELDFDLNAKEIQNTIELQISGNGIGGIGRIENDNNVFNSSLEENNQMFLIQVIPKIGKVEYDN